MAQTTESNGPLSKRKRVEETPVPSESVLAPVVRVTRSSKVWFDDGSVILQAEATQFKVHRSFLGMYSPLIKNALAHSYLSVEGCPMAHVSGSAEDLAIILQALYHRDSCVEFSTPTAREGYTAKLTIDPYILDTT